MNCQRTGEAWVVLPGWRADDGNAEVEYSGAESGEAAAQEYVDDGDWGYSPETWWCHVHTWRIALRRGADGEVEETRVDEETHSIEAAPDEPDCARGHGHDWQSPIEIVGGLEENPGVFGRGGGVIVTEVCGHCARYRVTDTWAQDSAIGEQGLRSVGYRAADERSRAWMRAAARQVRS